MLNLTHCEPYLTPVSSGWARVSTCTVQPYQVRTLYLVLNTKLLAVVVSVGLLAVGLIVLQHCIIWSSAATSPRHAV